MLDFENAMDLSVLARTPKDLNGVRAVMNSWGITGNLAFDIEGDLILLGKLGLAVANQDFTEFETTVRTGQTPDLSDPLTYQDVADYDLFLRTFKIVGEEEGQLVLEHVNGSMFRRGSNPRADEVDTRTDKDVWIFRKDQA